MDLEKVFANQISDSRFYSNIYKELLKYHYKKSKEPVINSQRIFIDTSPDKTYRW